MQVYNNSILEELDAVNGNKVITVSKEGGAMYESINDAIEYAETLASSTKRVTVLVFPGEYDEFIALDQADYIDLVGIDPNTCIVKSNRSYPEGCMYVNGTHYISNIQFISTSNSYGVHYETADQIIPGTTIFKNCKMHGTQASGIGIGLSANATLICEDCEFSCDAGPGLYFHNSAYSDRLGQKLTFRRCNIKSSGTVGIMMDDAANSYGNTNSKVDLTFNNCSCNVPKLKYRKNTNSSASDISYIPNNDSFTLTAESVGNNMKALEYGKSEFGFSTYMHVGASNYNVIYIDDANKYDWTINNVTQPGVGDYTGNFSFDYATNVGISINCSNSGLVGSNVAITMSGKAK